MKFVEKDFDKNVITQLKAMVYKVTESNSIGRTKMMMANDKTVIAVANHRGDDGWDMDPCYELVFLAVLEEFLIRHK